MNDSNEEKKSDSLPEGVFDIPGEPAVLINGVPGVKPVISQPILGDHCPTSTANPEQIGGSTGYGEWLVGREVRKKFGGQYYTGSVTEYDRESGWYRVVYKDGDFEDLDWLELREVLQPLDITVPLKSLASKLIKKGRFRGTPGSSSQPSRKKVVQSNKSKARSERPRGQPN